MTGVIAVLQSFKYVIKWMKRNAMLDIETKSKLEALLPYREFWKKQAVNGFQLGIDIETLMHELNYNVNKIRDSMVGQSFLFLGKWLAPAIQLVTFAYRTYVTWRGVDKSQSGWWARASVATGMDLLENYVMGTVSMPVRIIWTLFNCISSKGMVSAGWTMVKGGFRAILVSTLRRVQPTSTTEFFDSSPEYRWYVGSLDGQPVCLPFTAEDVTRYVSDAKAGAPSIADTTTNYNTLRECTAKLPPGARSFEDIRASMTASFSRAHNYMQFCVAWAKSAGVHNNELDAIVQNGTDPGKLPPLARVQIANRLDTLRRDMKDSVRKSAVRCASLCAKISAACLDLAQTEPWVFKSTGFDIPLSGVISDNTDLAAELSSELQTYLKVCDYAPISTAVYDTTRAAVNLAYSRVAEQRFWWDASSSFTRQGAAVQGKIMDAKAAASAMYTGVLKALTIVGTAKGKFMEQRATSAVSSMLRAVPTRVDAKTLSSIQQQNHRTFVQSVLPLTSSRTRGMLEEVNTIAEAMQDGKVAANHIRDALRGCVPKLSDAVNALRDNGFRVAAHLNAGDEIVTRMIAFLADATNVVLDCAMGLFVGTFSTDNDIAARFATAVKEDGDVRELMDKVFLTGVLKDKPIAAESLSGLCDFAHRWVHAYNVASEGAAWDPLTTAYPPITRWPGPDVEVGGNTALLDAALAHQLKLNVVVGLLANIQASTMHEGKAVQFFSDEKRQKPVDEFVSKAMVRTFLRTSTEQQRNVLVQTAYYLLKNAAVMSADGLLAFSHASGELGWIAWVTLCLIVCGASPASVDIGSGSITVQKSVIKGIAGMVSNPLVLTMVGTVLKFCGINGSSSMALDFVTTFNTVTFSRLADIKFVVKAGTDFSLGALGYDMGNTVNALLTRYRNALALSFAASPVMAITAGFGGVLAFVQDYSDMADALRAIDKERSEALLATSVNNLPRYRSCSTREWFIAVDDVTPDDEAKLVRDSIISALGVDVDADPSSVFNTWIRKGTVCLPTLMPDGGQQVMPLTSFSIFQSDIRAPRMKGGALTETQTVTKPTMLTLRLNDSPPDPDDPDGDSDGGDSVDDQPCEDVERSLRRYWIDKLGLEDNVNDAGLVEALRDDGGDEDDLFCKPVKVILELCADDVAWIQEFETKGRPATSFVLRSDMTNSIVDAFTSELLRMKTQRMVDASAVFGVTEFGGKRKSEDLYTTVTVMGHFTRSDTAKSVYLVLCGGCDALAWFTHDQLSRKMNGSAALEAFYAPAPEKYEQMHPAVNRLGHGTAIDRARAEAATGVSRRTHSADESAVGWWGDSRPLVRNDLTKTDLRKLQLSEMRRLGFTASNTRPTASELKVYRQYRKRSHALAKAATERAMLFEIDRYRGLSELSIVRLRRQRAAQLGFTSVKAYWKYLQSLRRKAKKSVGRKLGVGSSAVVVTMYKSKRDMLDELDRICSQLSVGQPKNQVQKRAVAAFDRMKRTLGVEKTRVTANTNWSSECKSLARLLRRTKVTFRK
jgi:hypothetical protein